MSDTVTEVTSRSWFGRLRAAISGVVVGLGLFAAAFPLLVWNEGRAVTTARSLAEGAAVVLPVGSQAVDSGNDGRLIHLSGPVATASTLADPQFGVRVTALKLARSVEMYQWHETSRSESRDKLGGGSETVTTYSYEKRWSASLESSAGFKAPQAHANPTEMRFPAAQWVAEDARLGAFRIPPRLIQRLDGAQPLPMAAGGYAFAGRPAPRLHDGLLYFGRDPAAPEVGDHRVRFTVLKPADASFVARQAGGSLEPYQAKAGGTVELVSAGLVPAAAMFQSAITGNTVLTWVLRGAGFLVMFVGLILILRPLVVVGKVVPLIGSILDLGFGIAAFVIAAVLSLIVIGVSWLAYRPLVGLAVLVVACGLGYAIRSYAGKKGIAAAAVRS